MKKIGLALIIVGILLYIVAWDSYVDTNEYYDEVDEYSSRIDNYDYEDARNVMSRNENAIWLQGFSQLLVFAGIGFILFGISIKEVEKEHTTEKNEASKAHPIQKNETEKILPKEENELEEEPDSGKIWMTCINCDEKHQIMRPPPNYLWECPNCGAKKRFKPKHTNESS